MAAQGVFDHRVPGHSPEPVSEPAAADAANFAMPTGRSFMNRLYPF